MPPKKPILPSPTAGKLLMLYYGVGVAGLTHPATRDLFTGLMPWSILGSTLLLLFYHRDWTWRQVLILLGTAVAGFLVEVAGVLTGQVFGEYAYGPALGWQVLETPLLIGVNWAMLIYCTHTLFEGSGLSWPIRLFGGALLMVGYDFYMEPVAIGLNMWQWGGGGIPLQNYLAWFVISLVFLAAMQLGGIRTGNRLAPWLFWVQAAFFLLLNFGLQAVVPN
jgi:putative membrane protein